MFRHEAPVSKAVYLNCSGGKPLAVIEVHTQTDALTIQEPIGLSNFTY